MIEQREATPIGEAPAFRRVLKAAQVVAATEATVLVLGESGTGKALLARAIHRQGRRSQGPFLVLACTGIGEESVDAELLAAHEQAAGGTLFLDEVAELPLAGQARLLRLLAHQEPGRTAQRTGPRVIAATSRDLWSAVQRGDFRRDLYYRLCVVPLELPPLRERVQDVPRLLEHFMRIAGQDYGLAPPRLTAGAERLLRRYAWPGNVRELRNLCERLLILASDSDIGPDNLPWEIRRGEVTAEKDLGFRLPASGIDLRDLEMDVIRQALALAGGNKSRAARLLGLTRDTLLYRMQKYLIKI